MKIIYLILSLGLIQFSTYAYSSDTLIVKTSSKSVDSAVAALKTAVLKAGANIFAEIDHAEGAKKAGINMRPTKLIILGNPKIGTAIIEKDRRVGLHLPLHVLIWEDDTGTKISYEEPGIISKRYNIKADDENLKKLSSALNAFTNAAQ